MKDFQFEFPEDVQLIYKQFPLNSIHAEAQIAAEASLAANAQGKFWEYHDLLYANQQALMREDLLSYADQLGMDTARFATELDNGRWKAAVQADQQDAARAGVNGTPGIYINGQKYQGPRGFPPEGLEGVARAYLGMGAAN